MIQPKSRKWDLTAIGDLNADLIMSEPASPPVLGQEILVKDARLALGGATSILATAAARLGLSVRLVGKVGDDLVGDFLLAELRRVGVDTSLTVVEAGTRTGITVSLTWPGDRALVTYLGPIATLGAAEIPAAAFEDTRHLHVSSFFLQQTLRRECPAVFRRARAMGATTSFDTGDDPDDAWDSGLRETLGAVDFFFPNRREAERISGEAEPERALAKLAAMVPTVVVKLGGAGAIASVRGERLRVDAFPVEPVDTTGAGDSFDAGYLWSYLQGKSPAECLARAAAAGALATTWLGGLSERMSAESVERLVEEAKDVVRVQALG